MLANVMIESRFKTTFYCKYFLLKNRVQFNKTTFLGRHWLSNEVSVSQSKIKISIGHRV